MPQFMVIGKDGTDDGAPARRAAARDAHIKMVEAAHARGEQLMGAAMLDDDGNMIGSVMTVDFPDRAALDAWLKVEPYIVQGVWQDVDVIPCKIPPVFLK